MAKIQEKHTKRQNNLTNTVQTIFYSQPVFHHAKTLLSKPVQIVPKPNIPRPQKQAFHFFTQTHNGAKQHQTIMF